MPPFPTTITAVQHEELWNTLRSLFVVSLDDDLDVHILFDERAFLTGLHTACHNNTEQVDRFLYPNLQTILERDRKVTSRLLFPSRSGPGGASESRTSHSLRSLGYDLVSDDVNAQDATTTEVCIRKIEEIIQRAQDPGTLVILSGHESGWLDDNEFASLIGEASAKQWRIEILAWNNSTRAGGPWARIPGVTTRRKGCITFLEHFYIHLYR